jgi:hypothetical protein
MANVFVHELPGSVPVITMISEGDVMTTGIGEALSSSQT